MDIFEQLRRDEGVRLKPYTDTVGKLTIGVGRNLTDKGISDDEATLLLQDDVAEVTSALTAALSWLATLDDARKGVLVNLAFNLGVAGLLAFHNTLTALQAGDWTTAAAQLLDSKWAGQVGARATRLADQIRLGAWQ